VVAERKPQEYHDRGPKQCGPEQHRQRADLHLFERGAPFPGIGDQEPPDSVAVDPDVDLAGSTNRCSFPSSIAMGHRRSRPAIRRQDEKR